MKDLCRSLIAKILSRLFELEDEFFNKSTKESLDLHTKYFNNGRSKGIEKAIQVIDSTCEDSKIHTIIDNYRRS
jgi:hypothetical protein